MSAHQAASVVKIGTSSITRPSGALDEAALVKLADDLASARATGHRIVLVMSGAIGNRMGPGHLGAYCARLAPLPASRLRAGGIWSVVTRWPVAQARLQNSVAGGFEMPETRIDSAFRRGIPECPHAHSSTRDLA